MDIEQLAIEEFINAFASIVTQESFPPGTEHTFDVQRVPGRIMLKTQWSQFPSPDSWPRKPTWEEIITAHEELSLETIKRSASGESINLKGLSTEKYKVKRDTDSEVTVGEQQIHVGTDLGHLAALVQITEHCNEAGLTIPHIIMRDDENRETHLHRQSVVRDMLAAAAATENRIESAHNKIIAQYHAFALIRDDESLPLAERLEATEKARELLSNYADNMQTEMASYDPETMPTDLDELKAVYLERLEAAALGKDKDLRGYVTNQGVMLHPTCTDQSIAQQEVSVAYTNGSARIRKADDAALAKRAFDKAVENIEAVEIKNTPVWRVNNITPTDEYKVEKILVHASQPVDQNIPGEVEIIGVKVSEGQLVLPLKYHKLPDHPGSHAVELIVRPGKAARVVLRARNICGVSRLTVTLEHPTPDP